MTNPFRAIRSRSISIRSHFAQAGRALAATAARGAVTLLLVPALILLAPTPSAHAQCVEFQADNHQGGGTVSCPCFIPGEEAGAFFDTPQIVTFPITILKVGIGWGSALGGQPQSIEQAFHIYAAGLPNPGAPIFTQLGPVLTDGVINEYDITAAGVTVSGGFSVTLEFLNQNASNPFAPSVVHDGNGCNPNRNLVFAIPGGWNDACLLGVTGDWVFYVKYTDCATGIGEERIAASVPVFLRPMAPNPFTASTQVDFFLERGGNATISVYDVRGREVAQLANSYFPAGENFVTWDGTSNGENLASGVYFVELRANGERTTRKVSIRR